LDSNVETTENIEINKNIESINNKEYSKYNTNTKQLILNSFAILEKIDE